MQGKINKFDPDFIIKNDSWVQMRRGFYDLFDQNEIDYIDKSESTFQVDKRTVAYLSFENRFASLGGLAAVARFLPEKLKESGENILFITPFHSNSHTKDAFEKGILEKCFGDLNFSLFNTKLTVSCYLDTECTIPSYFLQIKGRFFAGENPYEYDDPDQLLLDSLSFCAVIPYVLKKLGYNSNLILHANDWETAAIAISSKLAIVNKVLNQARTILTLHNSFDRGISSAQKLIFFGAEIPGDTILQCSIPFLNGPLTTVSAYFAHELRHDPLQKGIFTDHLQLEFSRNPPIGIENGLFGNYKVPFTKEIMNDAKNGEFESLIKEKNARKVDCLSQLNLLNDKRIVGEIVLDKPDTPVFFMSGRLDIMQKGFDVIFYAFKKLIRGSAKLIFCPSSGNSDIKFFKQIAQDCSGDIVICPFRVPETNYQMFLKGSSYLIMPSFYEPFGAATEGYIHGTPVLARGTGGLWAQVNSITQNNIPEYYKLLKLKNGNCEPTGILYREEYDGENIDGEWKKLLKLPLSKRPQNQLYSAMVESAHEALCEAIEVYSKPEVYSKMIISGINRLKLFSWENAVNKYRVIYDTVSYRGL